METLKKPKTAMQEVLFALIVQGETSIFDFAWMSGFRTRISDLKIKHELKIKSIKKQKVNKHGNTYTYCLHKLPKNEKQKAINLYINEKS